MDRLSFLRRYERGWPAEVCARNYLYRCAYRARAAAALTKFNLKYNKDEVNGESRQVDRILAAPS